VQTLSGAYGPLSLAIGPDGRFLASCGEDQAITLWSLPDGALRKTLAHQSDWLYSVAISPDGRFLASGGGDRTIKLWSLPDGNLLPICLMDPATSCVKAVAYTIAGRTYTVPFGSPIPPGATCTCNAVNGSLCGCSTVYYYPN
jgi:WD40 repeat protein